MSGLWSKLLTSIKLFYNIRYHYCRVVISQAFMSISHLSEPIQSWPLLAFPQYWNRTDIQSTMEKTVLLKQTDRYFLNCSTFFCFTGHYLILNLIPTVTHITYYITDTYQNWTKTAWFPLNWLPMIVFVFVFVFVKWDIR